jgi:molybdopterin-guanine dinucleotide biosynthesis protein
MGWSPQQDDALSAVAAWLVRGEPQLFRLFGYAGTGKTTLAKHIAEGVEGEVAFGAFTGKAASVLRAKGCPEASTISSSSTSARWSTRSSAATSSRSASRCSCSATRRSCRP